jgi:hypothetical protein
MNIFIGFIEKLIYDLKKSSCFINLYECISDLQSKFRW